MSKCQIWEQAWNQRKKDSERQREKETKCAFYFVRVFLDEKCADAGSSSENN
jgi:hypothetical protein